jgi:hypothetical protein
MIKLQHLLSESIGVFPLTREDVQEVMHKLTILVNEPDLQMDYGVTRKQVEALLQSIPRGGGQWQVSDEMLPALKGEMQDHIVVLRDIATDAFNANKRGQALRINKQAQRLERMFGI